MNARKRTFAGPAVAAGLAVWFFGVVSPAGAQIPRETDGAVRLPGPGSADNPASGAKEGATSDGRFGDKIIQSARELMGFDGGKRRVERESIVRGPDGKWCRESAEGLVPHPAQADYEAAEKLVEVQDFGRAASAFKRLAQKHKGSALEEDCLFQEAESYYRDGRLPTASDTYHKLMKDFPSTRHLPTAVQRMYEISSEWMEDSRLRASGKPGKYDWFTRNFNFTDRRRPLLDTSGRAIETIDHILQHDPNGPWSPSAAMMAGALKFTDGDYIQAAGRYEQVVIENPKNEVAAKAAILAAQSYLRSYQGPGYDGSDLTKAQEMTEKALRLGATLPQEQRDRLEKDLRTIYLMRAERDFTTAQEYVQIRKYQAAKLYFEKCAKTFPDTAWAKRAQEELKAIEPKVVEAKAAAAAPPASFMPSLSLPKIFSRGEPKGADEPVMLKGKSEADALPPVDKQSADEAVKLPPSPRR